jgi:hypothetical protein
VLSENCSDELELDSLNWFELELESETPCEEELSETPRLELDDSLKFSDELDSDFPSLELELSENPSDELDSENPSDELSL